MGKPGDPYEQEADHVADKVMSMPEVQRQPHQVGTAHSQPWIQSQPLFSSVYYRVQGQSIGGGRSASTGFESRLAQARSGGSPLPESVQRFMGSRLGADLSSVRVHTDSASVQMSREIGAQAFTHGSHIFYGAVKGPANDHLTAHELTHTIQQGAVVRARFSDVGQIQSRIQREPKMHPEISRLIQPLTLQGDWLQAQATAPGGPNPNCLQILGEILSFLFGQLTNSIGGTTLNGANLHRGLIERWQDLNTDTHNLYQNHRTRAQAHPQYGSWEGHVDQYRTQRQGLRQRISQWVRNNCDDPNNMGGMPEGAQNVIQNARRWVAIDPPNQPSASVQNAAPFQLPDLIPAFALSAAAAIGVSRSAMWKKFWQVVITRFGVRGGAAAALSAADGPLPVGELLSLGIAVWTLWDIYQMWDSLWQEAATQI